MTEPKQHERIQIHIIYRIQSSYKLFL